MAGLGPFAPARRVAVAVSGGADSTALAMLAAGWGQVTAFTVDHGLRPESGTEARLTLGHLARRGIPGTLLALPGLAPGPGLPARARAARYRALEAACAAAGLVDLLVGHHAADQAETVAMRQAAGSGADGMAGMAALRVSGAVRVLRPLLPVPPARLRATLVAAGLPWIEDPTNHDARFTRARLRGLGVAAVPDHAGAERHAGEAGDWPAEIAIHPAGYASLSRHAGPRALAAAIWAVSGRAYPPSPGAPGRAASAATLHGTRLVPHRGVRHVVREEAAAAPPVPAHLGAVWDRRFHVERCDEPGLELGLLGDAAAGLRGWSDLPAAVLRTFPALRRNGALWAVPHLLYPSGMVCASVRIAFRPAQPIAGSPFVPSTMLRGCT